MQQVTLLDITLRCLGEMDHGDTSLNHVQGLVEKLAFSGVDVIEAGSCGNNPRHCLPGWCRPPALQKLRDIAGNCRLALMLHPKTTHARAHLAELAPFVDWVRVAGNVNEISAALDMASQCSAHGIPCALFITDITACKETLLLKAVLQAADMQGVSALWLSDSRGAAFPHEISTLVNRIRLVWTKPLGFHGRNNIGLAWANTLAALQAGCTMVDGAVAGIGPAGGNTELNLLLGLISGNALSTSQQMSLQAARKSLHHLRPSPQMHTLYRLTGARNIAPEWIPVLRQTYQEKTVAILERFPRRRYHTLEAVLARPWSSIRKHLGLNASGYRFPDN